MCFAICIILCNVLGRKNKTRNGDGEMNVTELEKRVSAENLLVFFDKGRFNEHYNIFYQALRTWETKYNDVWFAYALRRII